MPKRFYILFAALLFLSIIPSTYQRERSHGVSDVTLPAMNGGSETTQNAFETITIDTWIKFYFDTPADGPSGNHPIMNEDHWDRGDLHYQIYGGRYGYDVNGAGDQTFQWQPTHGVWTYLSVTYSTKHSYIKLWVNGQFQETINCPTCTVPVTLDSPRIGAWLNPASGIERSMHGETDHPWPCSANLLHSSTMLSGAFHRKALASDCAHRGHMQAR